MKVGDTIYEFDINRRKHRRNQDGRAYGSPIWLEHWQPMKIIGETTQSWIIGFTHSNTKVNKKRLAFGELPHHKATWDEVEELNWVHEHKYKVVRLLEQEQRPAIIKHIASILGYAQEALDG